MFTRTIEDFTCQHCAAEVKGNGYTNHCPACLWGKHVDIEPGDRRETCGGMMQPLAARYERHQYTITHRCIVCGAVRSNRAAEPDNRDLLINLTAQPLP